MNCLIVAVVICLIISDTTFATDQHLICKSVDDVFSSDGEIDSRRLQGPLRNGRPGKPGPKGLKGDRGNQGRDGIVDYSSVNYTVKEAVAIATAKLQAKVEKLESEIQNLTDLFSNLDISALQDKLTRSETTTMIETTTSMATTSPTYSGDCIDGIIYGVKCYFVKAQHVNSRSHGEQICGTFRANLGILETMNLETLVLNYMKAKIPDGRSNIYVWTALRYEQSTGTVRLSDGINLSASTLRWRPGYPSGSSTGIKLIVRPDASDSDQGIYNFPDSSSADGVLCEK